MPIQTIEQKRAKYALEQVKAFVENSEKKAKEEWKSRANEIPAMIQMNGLGQTAAFYLSKQGIHKEMYDLLSTWLCHRDHMNIFSQEQLMDGITNTDMHTYRIAQAEAQALLIWVKKFSKAYC